MVEWDVRLFSRGTLRAFYEQPGRSDSRDALITWALAVERSEWKSPVDVKKHFGTADHVGNGRIVVDIRGNRYRLIARFNFERQRVYVRFVGTHEEYDQIDNASEV